MTDRINVVYDEKETELSGLIEPSLVFDENETK